MPTPLVGGKVSAQKIDPVTSEDNVGYDEINLYDYIEDVIQVYEEFDHRDNSTAGENPDMEENVADGRIKIPRDDNSEGNVMYENVPTHNTTEKSPGVGDPDIEQNLTCPGDEISTYENEAYNIAKKTPGDDGPDMEENVTCNTIIIQEDYGEEKNPGDVYPDMYSTNTRKILT